MKVILEYLGTKREPADREKTHREGDGDWHESFLKRTDV